jgi:dihydropteroate synthase
MDHAPAHKDVVREVRTEIKQRLAELIVHGVDESRVILDPGIGFAKTPEDNWQLLGHLDALVKLGPRVLVGASRKRFLAEFAEQDAPPSARDAATATISALAAQAGAWGVRVHDVASTRAALDVWQAWERGAAT